MRILKCIFKICCFAYNTAAMQVPYHSLVITRAFESQQAPLSLQDWESTLATMQVTLTQTFCSYWSCVFSESRTVSGRISVPNLPLSNMTMSSTLFSNKWQAVQKLLSRFGKDQTLPYLLGQCNCKFLSLWIHHNEKHWL